MRSRVLTLCVAASLIVVSADAAPPTGTDGLDVKQILSMAAGPMPTGPAEEGAEYPKFEDVTKDMKSVEGLFTLWFYPADKKDKDTEKLLCQIPAGFLGEKFMLSISFSGGGFFTGFPLEERAVQWEQLDRQLLLVQPETRFVVDKKDTVSDVVSRTYPERIRAAVPIVTKTASGDPVIDLGPLLKSDFPDISWMTMGMPGSVNPTLSKWTKKKAFELNVEIGVELAMSQMSPPGSYEKKLIHYSFWKLPQSDYTPRVADDRVGYFMTTNQDWGKPTDSRDIFNRYIDRWHLVKRTPELDKCEPIKPIIFYVEKTVPVRFRKAVRDGILEWNKAYEAIGFLDAVQVRQQTDDNEWKDLDPEDMRYSFFRWIVAGAGFAMGPHRANPFTGEIYDADIIFDDAMVRFFEREAQTMLPSAIAARKSSDPAMLSFLDHFPQFKRPAQPWETFVFGDEHEAELLDRARRHLQQHGRHMCDYTYGMRQQMAFAGTMLAGQPQEVVDDLLYEVIKEVVMHEVGHTLGLRHNFKASAIWTLDECRERAKKGLPTVGSVMDYNPVLFFKDFDAAHDFITPTIGPYDMWAIEYGYRPADGKYKAPGSAEDDKKTDEDAEEGEEKTDEPSVADAGTNGVPPDVLDKLPPEVQEMIKSGKGKMSMPGGDRPRGKGKRSSGPSFAGPNAAETDMLLAIASRASDPELAYATDEDTTGLGPDPASNRFDMGKDPLDWAQTRLDLVNSRMENILEWAVEDKESWYHVRQAFISLLVEKAFVMDYVGRYIGGQYVNRSHRGDLNAAPPFVPVDAETQRKALAFIEENLFNDKFFEFSPELLNHLAAPRWWHEGTTISFIVDFPVHRYIGLLQWWNLFDRMFPETLRRIHDGELKSADKNVLTLAEYLQTVQNACWEGTCDAKRAKDGKWTDADPFISSVTRSLQREYLGVMEPLARTAPGMAVSPDIHAMVQYSLKKLNKQIEDVMATGKLDFASEAHLDACKSRIDRMLAPELTEYGGY